MAERVDLRDGDSQNAVVKIRYAHRERVHAQVSNVVQLPGIVTSMSRHEAVRQWQGKDISAAARR